MQERLVTIDRETHSLSRHFTVFATQNPIEYEGTYPLPEAQKDRFMLKITMDFPEHDHEKTLAIRTLGEDAPEKVVESEAIQTIIVERDLETFKTILGEITFAEELIDYAVTLVRKTRSHSAILVGASPRALQALVLSGRAHAVIQGRDFVTPDDIKTMCIPVFEHRLILRPELEIEGVTVREIIQDILTDTTIPR